MALGRRDPHDRLIVALDLPTAAEALAMAALLEDRCRWFKVGLELFYAAGADVVLELRRRELNVFLDLKLHDIPNTVAAAVRSLSELGIHLLTVHAAGGGEMLAAAQEATRAADGPALLAVTVLTSMDALQLEQVGVAGSPATQVTRLARLAVATSLPGLVCSPLEVQGLREELGDEPLIVVPGVRPATAALNDQRRVATPTTAIVSGASMLVVGRPIVSAAHPAQAAAAILEEIASVT